MGAIIDTSEAQVEQGKRDHESCQPIAFRNESTFYVAVNARRRRFCVSSIRRM
jgi:hypothetical protein